MLYKYALLSGAALCLAGIAQAQSTQTCPTGATNCTISVQDAGHNSLNATADNSTTTSSIAGTSTASNQSGNTVAPVFDNSPQTTQNATTTTGTISSTSTGNTSTNDNASSATNGNQTMGQSNTGTSTSGGNTLSTGPSTSSTGASTANTGASTANTGASTANTGASTSNTGDSNAYLGGNTQANGSASTVGATTSSSGGNSLGSDARNSGGNSSTEVDASDRSSYKSIFIPPVVPGTPSSQLAIGNIIKETSACGPLQRIVRVPVMGTFIGLFRNAAVPQGYNDDLAPVTDAAGNPVDYRSIRLANGDTRLFGHQVVMFTTVIGIASNRNIALGGGGGGGSWGQGGMGSSSSNQRMVTSIQLRDCEIGTLHTVYVEVPSKPIRG